MNSTRKNVESTAWAGRGLLSAALMLALGGVRPSDCRGHPPLTDFEISRDG
jgi:hypothetical protein